MFALPKLDRIVVVMHNHAHKSCAIVYAHRQNNSAGSQKQRMQFENNFLFASGPVSPLLMIIGLY